MTFKQQSQKSQGVVILGMHRSGTSMLTGLFHLHGAYLGPVLQAADDNPKGFYEYQGLYQAHDRLFADFRSLWESPFPLPVDWMRYVANQEGFFASVLDDLNAHPFWVLKEPRMCRFFSWWREAFSKRDMDIRVVLALRHPMAVAASLVKRNNFSIELGLLLWLTYVLESERYSRGCKRSLVVYDELLKSPAAVWERAMISLHIDFPKVPSSNELADFVMPSLRHHKPYEIARNGLEELAFRVYYTLKENSSCLNCSSEFCDAAGKELDVYRRQYSSVFGEWCCRELAYVRQVVERSREMEKRNASVFVSMWASFRELEEYYTKMEKTAKCVPEARGWKLAAPLSRIVSLYRKVLR